MSIQRLYRSGRPVVSFEVFPPKKEADIAAIYTVLGRLAELGPDFISVTYGAGGDGGTNKTGEIAAHILREYKIPAMAHLTCVGATRGRIGDILDTLERDGVRDILALRGDLPEGAAPGDYRYAEALIRDLKARGGFSIGAACYPEGHISCEDTALDLTYLRRKQEAGADFLITQLFFDNDLFLRFLERARKSRITLPISAGVMPILGRAQVERMIFMCGASLPSQIVKLLNKYEHDPRGLRQAGIDYAAGQLAGLLEAQVDGVHIYTMNKADIASACMQKIGRV